VNSTILKRALPLCSQHAPLYSRMCFSRGWIKDVALNVNRVLIYRTDERRAKEHKVHHSDLINNTIRAVFKQAMRKRAKFKEPESLQDCVAFFNQKQFFFLIVRSYFFNFHQEFMLIFSLKSFLSTSKISVHTQFNLLFRDKNNAPCC
jgi:hypothetical protein